MEDQPKEPETETRTRRLKDGTIVSAPQDEKPRKKKRFKSQDPGRLGCSIIILVIVALMVLVQCLSEQ
jgi:hypothetical protein